MDTQNITLRLVSHNIALCVKREDEPIYREAAQRVNETYHKYAARHPKLTVEQLWVYVALELAVNFQSDVREKNLQPVLDKIRELHQLINETLTETT